MCARLLYTLRILLSIFIAYFAAELLRNLYILNNSYIYITIAIKFIEIVGVFILFQLTKYVYYSFKITVATQFL